jgi:hypothetical protein
MFHRVRLTAILGSFYTIERANIPNSLSCDERANSALCAYGIGRRGNICYHILCPCMAAIHERFWSTGIWSATVTIPYTLHCRSFSKWGNIVEDMSIQALVYFWIGCNSYWWCPAL